MAEGGHFGYDDPDHDDKIDHDDDDEQEVNRTQPFNPGRASAPYHGGEQYEMQTMHDEHTGMEETSYVETPLMGDFVGPEEKQSIIDRGLDFIKKRFPRVDFKKLGPIGFSKKGAQTDIVSFGERGGENLVFKKDGSGLLKSFTDGHSKALGPSTEQILKEDQDMIQGQRERLYFSEKDLQHLNEIAANRMKEEEEIENLKRQTEKTHARIDALQEEHGSNLESETELQRLKLLKKNYQTEYENKKKEVAALEKQAKNKQKAEEKVSKERAKLDEIVKKRNLVEEGLNSTKPLDDLNEREAELRQQNAEDQAIIDATDTSPSDRQAAEARVEERNEELARLQTQIAEREDAMPLREKIKEIFKKHGVTVTAILLGNGFFVFSGDS